MDNFNLRKYLANNVLLKEGVKSPKGSNVSDEEIRLYLSKDYPGAHSEEEVEEIINLYRTEYRDYKDPYGNLDGVAEAAFIWNKENGRDMITGLVPGSSKSSSPTFDDLYGEIEAAELELYGSDAAALDLDQWLNDLINASDEELMDINGGYYEIAIVLNDLPNQLLGDTIDNVKQWAQSIL